jgi:hypothetical protein
VQVKTHDLQFSEDREKGTYVGQTTVLVRITNAAGQNVHTLSQQYLLTGASKDIDAARQGQILFYRQPELKPGEYRLQTIVHDAVGDRASVRSSTISVPGRTAGRVPASTLILVRRVETVSAAERPTNLPFYYGDKLLYPNPGEPLVRGRDTELMFYFTFDRAPKEEPSASLELLYGDRSLASVPIELSKSTGGGPHQHVGKLPIDRFPPGTYELRLHLRTGAEEQVRPAFFTITE